MFNFVRQHAHHLVFVISIISLAALLTWWSVFIRNSIRDHRINELDKLELKLDYLALKLGLEGGAPPAAGILEEDNRFEIGSCLSFRKRNGKPLQPRWPDFCIRVHPDVLQRIEDESKSLNFMLLGESGLLLLIIFISSIFLYRFIQLERRTAREVKNFWERSAHEIKTPLTGIKAFLQNLKNREYRTEELLQYVDLALTQVEKQEQRAENVLSGYQLERQKRPPGLKGIALIPFLSEYFKKTVLHLTEANIQLRFEGLKSVMVKADEYRLGVILDNLVDNALKYGMPGLILEVSIREEKKRAVVAVKDNGPGFPSQLKENIFHAYRHASPDLPEGKRGAGIGLYISRQLARSMGGDLHAESRGPGKGAVFLISLLRADK
jgi:signal transduction histidine kinase